MPLFPPRTVLVLLLACACSGGAGDSRDSTATAPAVPGAPGGSTPPQATAGTPTLSPAAATAAQQAFARLMDRAIAVGPTPSARIPVTGAARYDGLFQGRIAAPDGIVPTPLLLTGDATLDVDFAAGTTAGRVTGLRSSNAAITGGRITISEVARRVEPGPDDTFGSTFAGRFTARITLGPDRTLTARGDTQTSLRGTGHGFAATYLTGTDAGALSGEIAATRTD